MTGNAGSGGSDPWHDLPPSVPDPRDPGDPDHPFAPSSPPPDAAPAAGSPALDAGPGDAARTAWAPPGGAAPPPAAAMPPMPALDSTARLTLGAGIALAVLGLLGVAIGIWSFSWSGIILILAGLIGVAGGWIGATNAGKTLAVAPRDIVLIGGTIGAVLGILFVLQLITDLDHLEEYGGAIGLIVTLLTAFAGGVLYAAAARDWGDRPLAPWMALLRAGLPGRLILSGAGLVVLGWLGNVTIGAWFLDAGVLTITFALLVLLLARAEADPDQPMHLPIPVAFIAIVIAGLAALGAIGQTMALADEGLGMDDWLAHLIAVAGVALVLIGAALAVLDTTKAGTTGTSG
jgi:hypothetical protein